MANILIIEANTPEMNVQGALATAGFIRTIFGLCPETRFQVRSPFGGPVEKDAFAQADGIVFTGSGVPWSTDAAEAADMRATMETAFEAGRPVWGSCNGMQLAAVVLGGSVGASPKGYEIGLARDIRLTDAGKSHLMMGGRADGFAVPCVHRDEVQRLPDGALTIATNAHSPVQAMVYQRGGVDFWGTQYHPELSPADIGGYLDRGIFASERHRQPDLFAAENDAQAAKRLGASPGALQLEARARELMNWLEYVKNR